MQSYVSVMRLGGGVDKVPAPRERMGEDWVETSDADVADVSVQG